MQTKGAVIRFNTRGMGDVDRYADECQLGGDWRACEQKPNPMRDRHQARAALSRRLKEYGRMLF